MILSTLFYILGILCLADIIPAVLALTKFGNLWNVTTGIAWAWIFGSLVSALIFFALATIIDRQRNIEKTLERIEEQLQDSEYENTAEWQKKVEDTLHRIDSNLFWKSEKPKE